MNDCRQGAVAPCPDIELKLRAQAHDSAAEAEMTRRVRLALEGVAPILAPPQTGDDLIALALYQITQAEGRLLKSWDGTCPLDCYLAVVAARVCVDELRRWQPAASPPADAGVSHPTDLSVARHVAGAPLDAAAGAHFASCARCGELLRAALGGCSSGRQSWQPEQPAPVAPPVTEGT